MRKNTCLSQHSPLSPPFECQRVRAQGASSKVCSSSKTAAVSFTAVCIALGPTAEEVKAKETSFSTKG